MLNFSGNFCVLLNWHNPFLIGILYGILVSLMGLVGDLIESMMKRDAKIKDSGTFLPGMVAYLIGLIVISLHLLLSITEVIMRYLIN